MDRFKFRIWDIKQQKYRQRTHHEADTCLNCLSGKVLYGEGIEIYGEEDDKDVVLEQCTGLKDKNGKLIYEGDLIKEPANKYPLEIYYDKGAWLTREYRKDGNNEQLLYVLVNCYGVEVIGNIHKNADLLGEE